MILAYRVYVFIHESRIRQSNAAKRCIYLSQWHSSRPSQIAFIFHGIHILCFFAPLLSLILCKLQIDFFFSLRRDVCILTPLSFSGMPENTMLPLTICVTLSHLRVLTSTTRIGFSSATAVAAATAVSATITTIVNATFVFCTVVNLSVTTFCTVIYSPATKIFTPFRHISRAFH
ncbi:unnamed protein product [Aphis gossypii]|uniref:Uncharacterized protein n=1 Tax=Aphis gossypii TaxID=80765 RepID=A0A9P0IQX4_APHGO|nr:unnamed protein product [Aphis gossypii]